MLHNNAPESINQTINGLKEKLKVFKKNEEMCKTIKYALRRVKIYNITIYEKKDIYINIMNERGANSVSITFPTTCWMKTKKRNY